MKDGGWMIVEGGGCDWLMMMIGGAATGAFIVANKKTKGFANF